MECKQARYWWPAVLWKNILCVFLWWSGAAATPSSHVYHVVKTPGGYTMYLFWGDNSPVWCVLKHIFADYMCKLYSVWLLTRSTSVHTWLVNSSFCVEFSTRFWYWFCIHKFLIIGDVLHFFFDYVFFSYSKSFKLTISFFNVMCQVLWRVK